jgi:hypothetical protein
MKQVNAQEFLALFDESVHQAIAANLTRHKSVAVVCFENQMFDSSAFGARSALGIGPNNTYKTVEACEGQWLNDLPSQRQYAQCWCPASEVITECNSPSVK